MGSQFSSGFVPSELRQHVERPLARVKVLFDAFKRLCRDEFQNNAMFITRDQFQRVSTWTWRKRIDTSGTGIARGAVVSVRWNCGAPWRCAARNGKSSK